MQQATVTGMCVVRGCDPWRVQEESGCCISDRVQSALIEGYCIASVAWLSLELGPAWPSPTAAGVGRLHQCTRVYMA
jgi:hypothetical protein